MIQAAPTPVRSLYDQGVRAPRGNGVSRALRGGLRMAPPITREDGLDVMNTNGGLGDAPPVSRVRPLAPSTVPTPIPGVAPVAGSPVARAPQPSTALPNGRYPISAYAGGSIMPPQPAATPATPTTAAAQQTESANPLTGDTNSAPAGKTQDLASSPVPTNLPTNELANARPFDPVNMNHGRALGFSAKGPTSPGGTDISPVSRPQFSSPVAGQIYDSYVKNVFSGGGQSAGSPGAASTFLQRAGSGYGKNGGSDDEN